MTEINQKEYLKKYLSIGKDPGEKKKKKKKKRVLGDRVKIIDDDVDVSNHLNITEEELFAADEDAPQIVGVIDERPPELRIADYRQSDLWQPVGEVIDNYPRSDTKKFSMNLSTKSKASSPPRKQKEIKDEHLTPPRQPRRQSSDASPPRRRQQDVSPIRRNRRQSHDSSPPRRSRRNEDLSPPRKSRKTTPSPPRKSRKVEDLSPPRKSRKTTPSPPRKLRKLSLSPVRRHRTEESSPKRRRKGGQDLSPPRKGETSQDSNPPRRNKRSVDSSPIKSKDSSPPRRKKQKSPERANDKSGKEKKSRWNKSASPEPKKMEKTLDGKTAGLQHAKDLVVETEKFKDRENSLFRNLSPERSGVNAATIVRNRKTGKIRNLEEEQEEQRKKQEEEDKNKEKYSKWGKGLKQVEDINDKIAQDLHEMSKPLARYADDEDLERFLKEQEREDDPMLAYIRKKRKKEAVASGKPSKPVYEGEFMPNRFGIRPGYRWDGVDRSSGYEKRWFEVQNAKRAEQEDVYKWSTEDM